MLQEGEEMSPKDNSSSSKAFKSMFYAKTVDYKNLKLVYAVFLLSQLGVKSKQFLQTLPDVRSYKLEGGGGVGGVYLYVCIEYL